ncbi:MAG: PAS domain S-box protein [Candidatus Thermoplasmatota archaeon]|nr:PAS domain S-box protein [Euryarchaeota archaeon]MBU4144727.1 PAS domain S-box protein [Candidatus Thermoplasmatota archaeon]MBU4591158.1 PAS domain S-box protein [Candidatus Thermoplasmatota archaeon]
MPAKTNARKKKSQTGGANETISDSVCEMKIQCEDMLTILDNHSELLYVSDPETYEVLFVNQKLRSLLKDARPREKCYELIQGLREPCEFCTNEIIKKTGMPHVWDYYNKHLKRHLLITDQMITWHDGRKVRFETAIDITDQKKIEVLLQASEKKYMSFIEQSNYGFFILNTNFEVTYLNDVARQIYGVDDQKDFKFSITDLLEPKELDMAKKNLKQIATGKQLPKPSIYNVTRTNGEKRIVEIQTFPIWRDDAVEGFHGTVIDITDRVNAEKIIKEKSEFLDAVINNTSDGIFVVDEDVNYVLINPASGRILGHDPKEWIGKKAGTYKHPEDGNIAAEAFMKAMGGEPSNCEIRVKAADGTYHLLEIRYNQMILNDNYHVLGMVTDITERKAAENALKESERRLREMGDNLPGGALYRLVHMPDGSGHFEYASQGIVDLFGLRTEDLMKDASPIYTMLHPDDMGDAIAAEKHAADTDGEFRHECRYILPDGTVKWIQWRSRLHRHPDGRTIWDGMCFDITSHRDSEVALQNSEEKYRNLFELSPESIMILDTQGKIIECNKATLTLFMKEADNIRGRKFLDLCKLDKPECEYLEGVMESILSGSRIERFEMEFSIENDENRWFEIFPSLIKRSEDNQFIQIIAKDVTDAKNREMELRKKFMGYVLEEGNIYLSKETIPKQSIDAFNELLRAGYRGTIITREHRKDSDRRIETIFRHVKISDTENINLDKFPAHRIRDIISELPRGEVVLINCIEYCISRMKYGKTLRLIQDIRDIATTRRLIIIMSIDPVVVREDELRQIEMETKPLMRAESIVKLPKALQETLEYIADANESGIKPNYRDIGDKFDISKPTVRARLNKLTGLGAITEITKGRQKILEISEKGKGYLVK